MVDAASRQLAMPPTEIRRRNFIRPEQMPYRTALGHTYDSGEFERNMNDAVKLADVAGFEDRKRAARARGRLRGLGLSTYVEACAGGPPESAPIQVARPGANPVSSGHPSTRPGHDDPS